MRSQCFQLHTFLTQVFIREELAWLFCYNYQLFLIRSCTAPGSALGLLTWFTCSSWHSHCLVLTFCHYSSGRIWTSNLQVMCNTFLNSLTVCILPLFCLYFKIQDKLNFSIVTVQFKEMFFSKLYRSAWWYFPNFYLWRSLQIPFRSYLHIFILKALGDLSDFVYILYQEII